MERQGVRLLRTLRSLVDETRQSRPKLKGMLYLEAVVQVISASIQLREAPDGGSVSLPSPLPQEQILVNDAASCA